MLLVTFASIITSMKCVQFKTNITVQQNRNNCQFVKLMDSAAPDF